MVKSQKAKLQLVKGSIAKKVAIYIRVSTSHQIDKDSLPFQKQELENYCRYILNTENFVVFEDAGYSAKNTDRPKFKEMFDRIEQGEFTHLLVWKLDRISRNLHDFIEMWDMLKEYGITFVSKMEQFDTSNAIGEAMLRIILVFAELERKLTAERVYSIMLSRAQKGQWNGAPVPLGYNWTDEGKTININESEAEIVRIIYNEYEKIHSTRDVANLLIQNGKTTKRGGTWGSKGVVDILRNPIYCGTLRWNYREGARGALKSEDNVIETHNAVPAIVTREQWNRVQDILDSNFKGRGISREHKHVHALSGLIKCGMCGKSFRSNLNGRPHKGGYHPTTYCCVTKANSKMCDNKTLSGLKIEPFLLEYIRAYVLSQGANNFNEELLKNLNQPDIKEVSAAPIFIPGLTVNSDEDNSSENEYEHKMIALNHQKSKLEQALQRLDDLYFFSDSSQVMSKTDYIAKRSDFQNKLDAIDVKIKKHSETADNDTQNITVESISNYLFLHNLFTCKNIRAALPLLDRAALKSFFNQIIKQVVVLDGNVTEITFHGDVTHKFIYNSPK